MPAKWLGNVYRMCSPTRIRVPIVFSQIGQKGRKRSPKYLPEKIVCWRTLRDPSLNVDLPNLHKITYIIVEIDRRNRLQQLSFGPD